MPHDPKKLQAALNSTHEKSELSRREFLLQAAVSGLALSAAGGIAGRAMASSPQRGGTFRIGLSQGATGDSLDPATYNNEFMNNLAGARLNNLTEVGGDGQLKPELAESWESSEGASLWRFKLRKGVEFHNGKTLTADDVLVSLQHHMGDDTKSGAKNVLAQVDELSKDGDDVVVVRLKNGNADLPYLFSDYHIPILPSEDGALVWQGGAGSGGYILEEFEPGVRARLTRNPNYWKEDAAFFDAIEMTLIPDANARVNAILTGSVDVVQKVLPSISGLVSQSNRAKILEVTGTQHYTMPMRCDMEPFTDLNVRLAIKYAVDRQQLLDKILFGHGKLGNDSPIAPANRYFYAGMEQREQDLDKAKYHLKQAGYDTLKVQLSASDAAFAGAVDAAVLLKESVSAAGIDIEIVREPRDGYWSNVWNKKAWCTAYWGGRPTEDLMFSTAYAGDSSWNDTAWKNERFNELLVAARPEADEDKRREMYHEMQQIVRDDGGALIPVFSNYIMALGENVGHPDAVSGVWELDGGKASERWWFT